MITAIVRFPMGQGTTRDTAKTMFENSVPNYEQAPGLVWKYYLYGEDGTGGGVYLWNSREDAERQYSQTWRNMITEKFGSAPEILFYETPVIVDNT